MHHPVELLAQVRRAKSQSMANRRVRATRLRNQVYDLAGGVCALCGTFLGRGWHVDHIYPWSKGGTSELENLQALCPECNLKKGTKACYTTNYNSSLPKTN